MVTGALAFASATSRDPGPEGPPWTARAFSSGPIQAGHRALACRDCHDPAPGTLRQQFQVLAKGLVLHGRVEGDLGFRAVRSAVCGDCHDRPRDRHPIHRFNEPRFREALATLRANDCLTCHGEHRDRRLRLTDTGYCRTCHDGLSVKNDPVDIPHARLVAEKRWDTCLGCHDFHGNHARTAQRSMAAAYSVETIQTYFAAGPSPYGRSKISEGRPDR